MKTPHIRTKKLVDPTRYGGSGQGLNAHWRIVKIAKEMANELFEVYMRDNSWWHKMTAGGRVSGEQARELFVLYAAPQLLEDARDALVSVLSLPFIPETEKDEIAEALILDNSLRGKRMVAERHGRVPASMH